MILPRSTQRPDAAVHVADPDDVGMQRAEERDAPRVAHTPQMLEAVHIDSSDPAARVLRGVLLIRSVAGVEQPVANSSSLLPKINNDFKVQSGPTGADTHRPVAVSTDGSVSIAPHVGSRPQLRPVFTSRQCRNPVSAPITI